MVFGNLSTGYWLGAAAAAGLHWVELGRKTLTGTGDTIDVTGIDLTTVTYGGSDITTDITWTQTIGSSTSDTFYILKDTSADVIDIKAAGNCGVGTSPSIAYATLPTALSTAAWTMRFKLVFHTVTAESTGGKSFFTNFFIVDNGTGSSETGSENGFGFKFIADAGSTQTQFYSTTSGTDSGTTMNYTPSGSSTIYVEISYSGGTATANFYSDSGYSSRVSSTTANATRSGTFSGLKHPQIALRQDNGGNGVMEIDMSELKIYNGGLTAKPYMMMLLHKIGANVNPVITFNSDTGSNYARRYSANGGSDSTNTSQTKLECTYAGATPTSHVVITSTNKSDQEKLLNFYDCEEGTAGAGNAPNRMEVVGKWANTSDQITSVSFGNDDSGDYAAGSEVVVLGYDPDDEEGTSVWEELASVDLSGGTGDSLSSGTISAKKYLWVQAYLEQSGSGDTGNICRFNSDSGSNYSLRYSENGGSDTTSTSRSNIVTGANSGTDGAGEAFYINMFIINKSDKEKLIIGELNDTDAGSGAGTAPGRSEFVGKWANTSGQITNITWTNSGGSATWATTSRLKVWGFD